MKYMYYHIAQDHKPGKENCMQFQFLVSLMSLICTLHICSCLIMWRSQPRRNSSHTSTHPLHRCHTLLMRIQWNTTSAKFKSIVKKKQCKKKEIQQN